MSLKQNQLGRVGNAHPTCLYDIVEVHRGSDRESTYASDPVEQ